MNHYTIYVSVQNKHHCTQLNPYPYPLGWLSLSDRRWYRRLYLFYKICNHDTPQYLHNHLPPSREVTYRTRSSREFYPPATRISRFTNSFYPYCISKWEKLSDEVRSLPTVDQFKSNLILYIRPSERPMYGIHNIERVKDLTKPRVEFSDLRYHRFNHNFNCKRPMCSCNLKNEVDNSHYFLRCPRFHHIRINLLSNISRIIGSDISILPCDHLTNIILYVSNVYNKISNDLILIETLSISENLSVSALVKPFPRKSR